MTEARAVAGEAIGTALLLAIIVGSGIMGEKLAAGNAAVALLANSLATGTGLYVLIVVFGSISGAHFNLVVSLAVCGKAPLHWELALHQASYRASLGPGAADAWRGSRRGYCHLWPGACDPSIEPI